LFWIVFSLFVSLGSLRYLSGASASGNTN